MRLRLLGFLIHSAQGLGVSAMVKYSALTIFAERFYPSLSRFSDAGGINSWLLQPVRESSLQLFSLVSIWISSKMHDSPPLSVIEFKSLGDKTIKDQHFTTRDFLEAEVLLMKVVDFELGTSSIAFRFLEDLLMQFKEVAKAGDLVNFEVCLDIMDLIYENEEMSSLYRSPCSLAASVLIVSYVISVPKQTWEFHVLPWVKFVTSCSEEDIMEIVRCILNHIFLPGHKEGCSASKRRAVKSTNVIEPGCNACSVDIKYKSLFSSKRNSQPFMFKTSEKSDGS